MEVVEGDGGVGASYLLENDRATGVGIDEIRQVVDFVIDNTPQVFGCVVLCDSIAGKGFARHVEQMRNVGVAKSDSDSVEKKEGAQVRKRAYRYIVGNTAPRGFASVRLAASLLRSAFRDGGVMGWSKTGVWWIYRGVISRCMIGQCPGSFRR